MAVSKAILENEEKINEIKAAEAEEKADKPKPKAVDLSYYFKGSLDPAPIVQETYAPSARLCDDDGVPLEWTFKTITVQEQRKIANQSKVEKYNKKTKQTVVQTDQFAWIDGLLDLSMIDPDFSDPGLLASWGAANKVGVLQQILTRKEYDDLALFVLKINGLDKTDDELNEEEEIEAAKNS